ncbi:MAG: alpha/beta hydrolase [Prosthecobacter sp.]|jgi:arylformamidase|uniref:alpha/beta hydrolase n=1 Tax=Prosthecobacter sp. TaxID=1965333 RepID=UPI0019F166EB|nr:alpha/beta hydrolase [Prosthecobacter sp.]MBE2286385.1 alpha/beta hydrolase [Prosthecobacter sp.]
MSRSLLALLFAVSASAVTPEVHRDLFYTEAKDKLQSLDVYSPPEGKDHPVIVWIHGGGWSKGDKASLQQKPQAFVDKGFVLVSVNYRLVPAVTVKDIMADLAQSVRWVRDHAAEHRGDANALIIMGHSAGAHLAALLCTDDRYLKAANVPMTSLKGCVPLDVSAYDIPKRIHDVDDGISKTFKTIFGQDEAAQLDVSPVHHVAKDKNIPSFLILHVASREDTKAQAHWLAGKLTASSIPARVVAAEGKTHGTISTDLGGADDQPTLELWKFLREVTGRP